MESFENDINIMLGKVSRAKELVKSLHTPQEYAKIAQLEKTLPGIESELKELMAFKLPPVKKVVQSTVKKDTGEKFELDEDSYSEFSDDVKKREAE